ncbi:MAG: virulence RhuM family protein [Erysipelotrichaceae bacterium]|nr:virulence RhuM family protein [Erysipelotrichaceae bacterium]
MSEKYVMTPYETREILFYKTDNGDVRVEILLYQENLWLTQAKMAELFEVQKAAISKHLKNIFESGELLEESVVSKMETTASDGKRYNINYYNLDAIIAVGYRVNSRKATMFRIWANRILKEFIIKGYVMDDERQARRGNVMYMRDWVERLDAFLQFNEEDILHDKGKVTAAIAKAFAESEFEKFRVLQDRTYQSDFDRLVAAVEDKCE